MASSKGDSEDNLHALIGKSLESLPLTVRQRLAGFWVATELYSTVRLPLRVMQAIAPSAHQCVTDLKKRQLDPSLFEYELVPEPFVDGEA